MEAPKFQTLRSTMQATVVSVAAVDDVIAEGGVIAIVESMKMEHGIVSTVAGTVTAVVVSVGESVREGSILAEVRIGEVSTQHAIRETQGASPRLQELRDRAALLLDAARPEAVAKRHARGLRTARENLDDLLDPGSYVEYGRFAYAAQSSRRPVTELITKTPADGLVSGIGTVDGQPVAALSYDATVLAGTQGQRNHQKKDRLFGLVARQRLPLVLFTEGGGGRPGDTDVPVVTGLHTTAFAAFAKLSGLVPTIGIAAGRCFAGNAALLGCCDIAIGVKGASIGMGGPAMIEGGGLGTVSADEVGPLEVHVQAGSIDLVADDEAHAVALAKQLLGFAQRAFIPGTAAPVEDLETILPSDRRRAYDVRVVLEAIFDTGSVLEIRSGFGTAMVTAFARLEGRPVAVLANNPLHNAGAIDADAADKAAHFFQLAESWGLPVVSLVDTPGFMVGPEAETTGLVRHVSRMFVASAALTVPFVALITRRGYGLGAQAMCGGSFVEPLLTVAWPQAELGGMGLEGAVRLGFRAELEAIADEQLRAQAFDHMVAAAYEHGRSLNVAAHLELDDVIDPLDTRRILGQTIDRALLNYERPSHSRFVDPF